MVELEWVNYSEDTDSVESNFLYYNIVKENPRDSSENYQIIVFLLILKEINTGWHATVVVKIGSGMNHQ